MPGKYAEGTGVTPDRSRSEIEQLLKRFGASSFGYIDRGDMAVVGFEYAGRTYRYYLKLPNPEEFSLTPSKMLRSPHAKKAAWEQAIRERWRALVATIKAKLIAVESGITTFEEEWMAHVVMPNGQTAGEWLEPQLEEAYRSGRMPPILPPGN